MNRRRHTQTLTYWAPLGENAFGEEGFGAPVVINGRWEARQEKVTIPSGTEIVSKAFAYSDVKMAINGYVALGSFGTTPNPLAVPEAELILGNIEVASLRTNTNVRAVIL